VSDHKMWQFDPKREAQRYYLEGRLQRKQT
jgi:hypothetical protein